MPTEQQYRAAAERFSAQARAVADWASGVPSNPTAGFLDAPNLAPVIDRSFAVLRRRLLAAAAGLTSIAQTCDARADVCREYRRRLWVWSHASPDERVTMPYPSKPAAWVDA